MPPTETSPSYAHLRAVEARNLVSAGRLERAQQVLDEVRDVDTIEVVVERERLAVTKVDLTAAERVLERWPTEPDPRARWSRMLWSAVVAEAEGHEDRAIDLTSAVVRQAGPDEFIGLFLDVGRPVLRPARALYAVAPSPFLRAVLEHPALRPRSSGRGHRRLVVPLTDQESVVLGVLPSRLANAAIAEQLGVSSNTIKTHLKHIYQKLNVTCRSEAVDVGERLGLL